MHALRRITYAKPIHSHTVHHQINRNFSNPKAIPQLSRRSTINVRTEHIHKTTPSSSTLRKRSGVPEIEVLDEVNNDENENKVEPQEDNPQDCPLSNPYYSRLLDSKLDSCPQQPFNETTHIICSAVYDTLERGQRIESMSRWEQIQRGYIRQETISSHLYHSRRSHRSMDYEEYDYQISGAKWTDTIFDVNDLLQTHHSLDDCIRNEKHSTASMTLAKATGSLDTLLDSNRFKGTNINDRQNHGLIQDEMDNMIQMKTDLKWKKYKMKKHIKKKRRDKMRMTREYMRKRKNQ